MLPRAKDKREGTGRVLLCRGATLALLLTAAVRPASGAFEVDEEKFSSHELSDISDAVRLSGLNGSIAALGDFDSDQYTDLLVLSPARDSLSVLRWDHELREFMQGPRVSEGVAGTLNVIVNDFNRDGKLDVILVRERPSSKRLSAAPPGEACTLLTFIPGHTTRFGRPIELPPAYGQVLAANFDSDPATDLFGEACEDETRLIGRGSRSVWRNDGQGNFTRAPARFGSRPLAGMPSPAAVDIDGDCRADLVVPVLHYAESTGDGDGEIGVTTIELEVWLSTKEGLADPSTPSQQSPDFSLELPAGIQQLTWADLNGDGALDAIAPLCDLELSCAGTNLNATRGQLPRLALISTQRRPVGKELCVPDAAFALMVQEFEVGGLSTKFQLRWAEPSPLQPPSVRLGDFDLDGYPDALAGFTDELGRSHVALLRNKKKGAVFEAAAWRVGEKGVYVLQPGPAKGTDSWAIPGEAAGAHGGAFVDVDERGNLDILLLSGSVQSPSARLLKNAFSSDGYFLKVLALDGQCLRWCAGGPDPSPPPYGVSQPAVSYQFASKGATGVRRVYTGAQLPVSAHTPLLTPYLLFGLRRTNDYVTDFWVGMPNNKKRRFDAGIIPNSQLIVIPYPPDRPHRWTIELYISKADMLPWVALALSAGLSLIGLSAIALEWRERREDVREKKAHAPSLPL
mmetsp:Transcript_4851/g.12432  ORF Transcript_4851/g.12432 Transcript_4851/m.12432 type:complete len:684 (+) Transcript_4851:70-2121(+)